MCGIFGLIGHSNPSELARHGEQMLSRLSNRGPDYQNYIVREGVLLGNTRLMVVNTNQDSNQPFFSSCGRYAIVFNGEIYNYKALSERYSIDLASNSDTELLLRFYISYGSSRLSELDGMYAFCIYDFQSQTAYLHRDDIGIKPLYYSLHQGSLVFASEIKALLPIIPVDVNPTAIHSFIARGDLDNSEHTFFLGIKSLQPGQSLKYSSNGLFCAEHVPEYLNIANTHLNSTPGEISDAIESSIIESVELQFSSSRSHAIHLSGGFDSTLLAALSSKYSAKTLCSHTFGYEDKAFDESESAAKTAFDLGLQHSISWLDILDFDRLFLEVLRAHDEPFTSIRQLSHYKLYKDFKEHSTVVFEASGGDEIGCGYRGMIYPLFLDEVSALGFTSAYDLLSARASHRGITDLARFCSSSSLNLLKYGMCTSDGTYAVAPQFLCPSFFDSSVSPVEQIDTPFHDNLRSSQYYEARYTKLPRGLRYVDRSSSSNGKEARVPLLTNKILGLGLAASSSQKISLDGGRVFLNSIGEKLYPPLASRKLKKDVADPQLSWMKGPLKSYFLEVFNSKRFFSRPFFDASQIQHEFDSFLGSTKASHTLPFFSVFIVEIWLRLYIDQPSCVDDVASTPLLEFIKETNSLP